MRYHKLGRTGLYVSELCLGTMTFGGKGFWKTIGEVGAGEATTFLKTVYDAGVNFIDTANVYHEGESERLLGQVLKEAGIPRHKWVIATKVRGRMGRGPNDVGLTRHHIMNQLDASLSRLGLDYIDLYQVHGFDPETPLEETLRALDDAVRQGKVRYLGLCNYAAWQIMKALAISEQMGWHRFQSAQVFYSVAGRDIEREIVPLAQDQGLSILPWSPLAGGLLSGKFRKDKPITEPTRRAAFDFPPVNKERALDAIEVMAEFAQSRGVSIAQIALNWLLLRPCVSSVIIGARTVEQLQDNLKCVNFRLSDSECKAIDKVSSLPQEYPGWMLSFQNQDRTPGGGVSMNN